jgi:hypothetical protein
MHLRPAVIPADLLPVVRAADLDDHPDQPPWLIDKLWSRSGVGILGGAPKCCKSWLGLDMAISVASATACVGALAVSHPGPVLIYMAEDAAAIVKTRIASICRHRRIDLAALPLNVITEPVLRLDLNRDQKRLDLTVHQHRPRLLVLDPFVRLHRIDENHAGDVSALLAYLRAIQRRHDVAILVVHHARKNGPIGAQAGQGLRGSGDLHAWGDDNLYLRRQRDQLLLTIEHRASAAPQPLTLCLVGSEHDAHLELAHAEPAATGSPAAPRDLQTEILGALASRPLSRTSLRASLRVRNERLGEALTALAAQGLLLRHGQLWARRDRPIPPAPASIQEGVERNPESTA